MSTGGQPGDDRDICDPDRIAAERERAAAFTTSVQPLTQERLAASFDGSFRRAPLRLTYRIGLTLVALLTLLLPLTYLALVSGVIAFLVCYCIATAPAALEIGSRLVGWVWALPVGAGIVVACFLLTPFSVRRRGRDTTLMIDPPREPLLTEFVHRVADLVGAPRPYRIGLDLDVNASALCRTT